VAITKTPTGARSPNLADSTMILYAPQESAAYFGSVGSSAQPAASPGGVRVVELPPHPSTVFLLISFGEDSVAALLGAHRTLGTAVWAWDWDLKPLGPGVTEWVWAQLLKLEELFNATSARSAQFFVDDPGGGYRQLLEQRGLEIEELPKDFPLPEERAGLARGYVQQGHLVLTEPAASRVAAFRGAHRNFLRELLSAPTPPPESNALGQALACTMLLAFHDRAALREPQEWEIEPPAREAPPAPPAPILPAPGDEPGAMLSPGHHVVDGLRVRVPHVVEGRHVSGNAALVFWPLTVGRHVVDGIDFRTRPNPNAVPVPAPRSPTEWFTPTGVWARWPPPAGFRGPTR